LKDLHTLGDNTGADSCGNASHSDKVEYIGQPSAQPNTDITDDTGNNMNNNTDPSTDPSLVLPTATVTPISPEAKSLNDFNKIYTTLVHGGKNYVIRNNTDPFGHNYLEFFTQKEFIDSQRDKPKIQVIVEGGSGPTVKQINPARVWIESPESNSAKYGLTFYPELKRFHNGKFNTYMGRGCNPVECQKKELSIYLKHIHKVICNNDDNAYKYVIQWLAHLVQKPTQ
jgi:hypothetical protein